MVKRKSDATVSEHDAFRTFEHTGWQSVTEQYHAGFAHLTSQAIEPLLDAVQARAGMRLLDVASGPGYVAAAAAQRGASVIGIDFAAEMVALARQSYPNAEFQEDDAEALSFPDNTVDAVTINFGVLHLGRPDQALAEAYRVLRPSGRLGFTVWAKPEEAVGFAITLRAIQEHGNMNVPLPQGPPFFRFSDAEESQRSLLAAGFVHPAVQFVPQVWHLHSPDALFDIMHAATVRTAGLLRAQSPEALHAIRMAMRESVMRYRTDEAFELPMPAVLSSAVKP